MLAWPAGARAQEDKLAKGPVGGQQLAAEMNALRPVQDTNWQGVLKISGRNHKTVSEPITAEWKTGETTWSVTYMIGSNTTTASERLRIVFSTNGPPEYWYAKASAPGGPLGAAQKLSGHGADIPFGGSDFWLSDLGFEFYHWPGQNKLPDVLRRGQSCYVLECTDPQAPAGSYSRVRVWIDMNNEAPLEAEAYGTDGRLLKDFELGSVTKVNGKYELKDLKITNEQTNSRTQLLFDLGGAAGKADGPAQNGR
jgi:hypothetical protein